MLPYGKPSGQWFRHGGGINSLNSKKVVAREEILTREEMFKYFQQIFEIHLCGGRLDVEAFVAAQAAIKRALEQDITDEEVEEELATAQQKAEDEKAQAEEEERKMTRAQRQQAMKERHQKTAARRRRKASGQSAVSGFKMGLTEAESKAIVSAFFDIAERSGGGRHGMQEVFREFCDWQRRRLQAAGYTCKQVAQRLRRCFSNSKGFGEFDDYDMPQLPLVDPHGDRRQQRLADAKEVKEPIFAKAREDMRAKFRERVESEIEEVQQRNREQMAQMNAARKRFLKQVLPILTEEPKPRVRRQSVSSPELPTIKPEPEAEEPPPDFDSLLQSICHSPQERQRTQRTMRKAARIRSTPVLPTMPMQVDRYNDFQRGTSTQKGSIQGGEGDSRQGSRLSSQYHLPAIN
eukprot:TRINITY_DN41600_c0_g1_i1.p1 TRINITY_DN41600_c0_g1~~TRINITY_DN41600_c0_g1_i1.p1  ORF type:complete len:406 (+),score=127.90 TRINITY_DN41600_c0_g1_i1:108-1325(+)